MWSSQNRPALLAECRSPWPHLVNWRQLPKRDVHLPCDLADPPLGLSPAERRSRVCRGRSGMGTAAPSAGETGQCLRREDGQVQCGPLRGRKPCSARVADSQGAFRRHDVPGDAKDYISIYIQCVHREVQMELSRAATVGAQGARAVAEGPPTAGFLRLRSPCACGYPGVCTP